MLTDVFVVLVDLFVMSVGAVRVFRLPKADLCMCRVYQDFELTKDAISELEPYRRLGAY
jgi:hypothetical protein